jgi:fatty acid desaturase
VSSALHATSDAQGFLQTLGFLGMLAFWFGAALYLQARGHMAWCVIAVALYGMQANFLINGMHELGHGFVFRTKWLNGFFCRIVSFLGWLHPDMFFASHLRHHRYTQNYPYDQENPMPVIFTLPQFLAFGFINIKGFYDIMAQTLRAALGIYPTKHLWWTPAWEDVCYPPEKPEARLPPMRWAWFMLAGHMAIAAVSLTHGMWLIPVLVSFGPFLNGWLFFLCNSTQHTGMQHGGGGGGNTTEEVEDFRLSCRTFYLGNPVVQMWYWHMNYHIEHHMYAAVPCYNLGALHKAILHDLPPTPNGIVATWRIIIDVMSRQKKDPSYVMPVELPRKTQPPRRQD